MPPPIEEFKLDKEKQKLIEEYHPHIIKCANQFYKYYSKKQRIDFNEILGSCYIGFINCLKTYNNDKGNIFTYSKNGMRFEVLNYIRINHTYNKHTLLSKEIDNINNIDLFKEDLESIMDDKNYNEDLLFNLIIDSLLNQIPISNRDINIIYKYIIDKDSQTEIAKQFGISKSRVGQIISKFREQCNQYINEKELMR